MRRPPFRASRRSACGIRPFRARDRTSRRCPAHRQLAEADEIQFVSLDARKMTATELARGVMEASLGSRDFARYSRSLASLAFSRNRKIAAEATHVVFADVVQPLADRFEDDSYDVHAAFMAEAVHAPGSPITADIEGLGYAHPQDLIERYGMLRSEALEKTVVYEDILKVVVLSRVEIRADVAITSTILQCANIAFRSAELDLVAPKENAYLIGIPYRMNRKIVSYPRDGPLANRLLAWKRVRDKVRASIEDFQPGEWLVVDPDSCITQNGLLPLTDDGYVRFFDSRSYAEGERAPIAELAADWCGLWFFWGGIEAQPFVAQRFGNCSGGSFLSSSLRKRIAGVSFAVDGKESARLGGDFEDALLELLRKRGYWTVLDCGRNEADAAVAAERVHAFRGSTNHLTVIDDARHNQARLMACKATPATFGGWVSRASVYVGYDSAMSHVVATFFVPVIQVSAGAPNEMYRARWTPVSDAEVVSISAKGPEDGPGILKRIETALERIEENDVWAGLEDIDD